MRLSKAATELNISIDRIGEFLETKNLPLVAVTLNSKISDTQYETLLQEFKSDLSQKQQLEAQKVKTENKGNLGNSSKTSRHSLCRRFIQEILQGIRKFPSPGVS